LIVVGRPTTRWRTRSMFDENYIGQFSQKMNKLRENRNRSAEPSHLYRPRIPVLLHLHALNILARTCSYRPRYRDSSCAPCHRHICQEAPHLSRLQRVSASLRRALDRVGDCDAQRGRYPGGTKSRGAMIGRRLPSPDGIQQTRLHNLDHFLTTRKDA
jgi:hypothetical protein